MAGEYGNNQEEQEEKEKKILLWSGISFFMVMIFLLWSFNIQDTFKKIEKDNTPAFASQETGGGEEIDDILQEIQTGFEEWEELRETGYGAETSTTTSKEKEEEKLQESLNALNQELQKKQE